GLFLLVILLEPDLGTAITLAVMVAAVLFASGTRVRTLGAGFLVLSAVGLLVVLSRAYMRARLFSFLDPWHDSQVGGYQIVQAQIGLGSGPLFGEGLGQGVPKVHYLPEAHTHLVVAV